jgi:hypothetical protein
VVGVQQMSVNPGPDRSHFSIAVTDGAVQLPVATHVHSCGQQIVPPCPHLPKGTAGKEHSNWVHTHCCCCACSGAA